MGQEEELKHRLAAIMATDVVGYSQSMQSDEARTLAALSAIRGATENQIKQHRGRIANTAGDSVLAEFGSAVEAASCAMVLQETLSKETEVRDLQVRIGIHLGDVVDKGGDLFGTAVNVAARLEGIAQRSLKWRATVARPIFKPISRLSSLSGSRVRMRCSEFRTKGAILSLFGGSFFATQLRAAGGECYICDRRPMRFRGLTHQDSLRQESLRFFIR
jgi:hypothetical protein